MKHLNGRLKLLLPAVVLLLLTCNKHISDSDPVKADLIKDGRAYIQSLSAQGHPVSYRAAQAKTVRWDLARVVSFGQNKGILAPIIFNDPILAKTNFSGEQPFHLNYLTQLLFFRDSAGNDTAMVITAYPDSNYFKDPTQRFTGIKFFEDWQGQSIEKLLYMPSGKIRRFERNLPQPTLAEITVNCYTINGYNYS